MANTLGLDDDLDPVEVAKDLEQAFAFKLSDEEAQSCSTVGDIYAVLLKHIGGSDRQSKRCATAMTFFRLRRAFRVAAPEVPITVATPMHLFNHLPAKPLIKQIRFLSGLQLPGAAPSKVAHAGVFLILSGILGVFASAVLAPSMAFWSFQLSLAMTLSGMLLTKIDKGRLPNGVETVGDLARMAATKNFGVLVQQGARWSEESLWAAMVEILAERATLTKSEIRPDTLLLAKALRR